MTSRQLLLMAFTVALALKPHEPTRARAQCLGDFNHNGEVTIDEIIISVKEALTGCTMQPTPTVPPSQGLAFLLGTWRFDTTIGGSIFMENYRLDQLEGDNLFGTDLSSGNTVLAQLVTTPGSPYTSLTPTRCLPPVSASATFTRSTRRGTTP
jgi:hypothetical protein